MIKKLFIMLLIPALFSCKNTGSQEEPVNTDGNNTVSISILTQLDQCFADNAGAEIISSSVELEQWWKRVNRTKLPAPTLPAALGDTSFDNHQLIVANLGAKPSTGYSVELLEKNAVVENNNLELSLRENAPPGDRLTAQVVTQPCVILRVDKKNFSTVVVKWEFTTHLLIPGTAIVR